MTEPNTNAPISLMTLYEYAKPDDFLAMALFGTTDYNSGKISQSDFLAGVLGLAKSASTIVMADDLDLVDTDPCLQFLDPDGTPRIVKLPVEADTNHAYVIVNTGTASITVNANDDSLVIAISSGQARLLISDGSTWVVLSGGGDAAAIVSSTTPVTTWVGQLWLDIS